VAAKKAPANKKAFTEEMAQIILNLGKQGASQKAMFASIDISKSTAAKWKKENEHFAETLDLATVYAQAYWENMMLANIENKSFNSRVAEIALRGQFAEDYKDSRDSKVTAAVEVKIDFAKEINELIHALKT
jgi:DNA-binding XRE family transcriptional regulator